MEKERESLELVRKTLAKLEQLQEAETSLSAHRAGEGEEQLVKAQEALSELLHSMRKYTTLNAKVVAQRKAYGQEEDNRKRLGGDNPQAVLNPSTNLYQNNVLRLYK